MSEENMPYAAEEEAKSAPLTKLPDLKTLREERGLTIEDIFLKTRVNSSILIAIENGDFHLLPAPVSTKKFIRIYAETIGIDAEIILARYQRYVNEIAAVPEQVNVVKAGAALERKPFSRYLWYVVPVVVIIAAAIMYAVVHEYETGSQSAVTADKPKETAPSPALAPVVKEQPPAETAIPTPPPPAVPPAAAPPVAPPAVTPQAPRTGELTLLIEATEDTWLKITEDRNPPYQVTLKTGKTLSRTAREFFVIDVGNAAGVNVTFRGKSLGSLGRKGQVVHLRLPQ